MEKKLSNHNWIRFGFYLLTVVLLYIAAQNYFIRIDLTKNRAFTLSELSKETVNELEEPMIIKAYFSKNLPASYNSIPIVLRDLLQAYSLYGNNNFSYQINTIDLDSDAKKHSDLQEEAQSYGIYPVDIQDFKANEASQVAAFLGLVIVQGDAIETVNPIRTQDNLEYSITTLINRMSKKSTAFLSLAEPVQFKLYATPKIFQSQASFVEFTASYEAMVDELNKTMFGKLEFSLVDPSNLDSGDLSPEELGILGTEVTLSEDAPAETIYLNVVLENQDARLSLNLLQEVPLFNSIQLVQAEEAKTEISDRIVSLIGINEEIAYVSDYGTTDLDSQANPYQQQGPSFSQFKQALEENYSLTGLSLKDGIPESIQTLLLLNPIEKIDVWSLYQLDQFLMRGGSLAVFMDPYNIVSNQQQSMFGGPAEQYIPNPNLVVGEVEASLNDLLEHYGIKIQQELLFDEESYVNNQTRADGQFSQNKLYFAPMIKEWGINKKSVFTKGISLLIFDKTAPLDLDKDLAVISSSKQAWVKDMTEPGSSLASIQAPAASNMESYTIAGAVDGELESFFKGKDIPDKPAPELSAGADSEAESTDPAETGSADTSLQVASNIVVDNAQVAPLKEQVERAQIFVVGSINFASDSIFGLNANFILNALDSLNKNNDLVEVRSKGQSINPLVGVTPTKQGIITWFNLLGLPIIVIIAGLLVFLNLQKRRLGLGVRFSRDTSSISENKG